MIHSILDPLVRKGLKSIYDVEIETLEFQETRKDFEGDVTLVVFPLLRQIKGNPAVIAETIGNYLLETSELVSGFNVIKGFLNLVITDEYYLNYFNALEKNENFGRIEPAPDGDAIMVEYSSPNTNKPLHLGHIRNNLLGYSVSEILAASGKKVYKTQIINDRGIHICKSMVAWRHFGNGETPESTGLKGDKLVGNYYVRYDQEFKKQVKTLIEEGLDPEVDQAVHHPRRRVGVQRGQDQVAGQTGLDRGLGGLPVADRLRTTAADPADGSDSGAASARFAPRSGRRAPAEGAESLIAFVPP